MKTFLGNPKDCIDGIWITQEYCLCTNKTHTSWEKFWLKFLLGWKIERRKAHEELKGFN